jgi:hypothetical protein
VQQMMGHLGVNCREGVVEEHKVTGRVRGAGESKALTLPARECRAALAHLGAAWNSLRQNVAEILQRGQRPCGRYLQVTMGQSRNIRPKTTGIDDLVHPGHVHRVVC